ncbi:hypothetical protein HPB52_000316 [Rhipicephalus sanguineus]|uniref:Uncharacterized protein n=1 Tax=Rhipicephalus sanguineus TaxID=34632 RepID=A0A9D4SPM4_RHISA|nr:hypothetical protein HPB52_000316 [Rhipicephalus sanguineus]
MSDPGAGPSRLAEKRAAEDPPAAEKPAKKAPEGESDSFKEFVDRLAATAPTLFRTEDEVRAIFTAADREFVSEEASDRRMSPCCTHYEDCSNVYVCWAVWQQKGWTKLLGPRGIELVELDVGRLRFRTLNVNPEDLLAADDAKFLCLCLWLLQQHRCISSVYISVPTVAPRHGLLFLSLLKLTMYVTKLEITCDDSFREMSVGDLPNPSVRIPPILSPRSSVQILNPNPSVRMDRQPWMHVLDNLCNLRELRLSSMYIRETDASALMYFLKERSACIVALVLIDVEFSAATFYSLIEAVKNIENLKDLRIKTSAIRHGTFEKALSLHRENHSLQRLYVHADCSISSWTAPITLARSLSELTLEPTIRILEDLEFLCGLLHRGGNRLRLKICLDMSEMHFAERCRYALMWLVWGSCVETLILSGSTINLDQSCALAKALTLTPSESYLKELHLDECGIECEAVEHFAEAIAFRNHFCSTFKELNVGAIVGDPLTQRRMFRCIRDNGVRGKITLICTECLIEYPYDWNINWPNTPFTKVSLSISDGSNVERVLHKLMDAAGTLESLSIDSNGGLTKMGGQVLANLIGTCSWLRVLRLRCHLTSNAAVLTLAALEESLTVLLLTVEHWVIDRKVKEAFEKMLTANGSLFRLEFYWEDFATYQGFKPFLKRGLLNNSCVMGLKMYQGELRDEIIERDPEILLSLQRNEMALAWATKEILLYRREEEGTLLAAFLDVFDAPLDLYQRVADFSQRTADNRVRLARMNTRSAYYALRYAFPNPVRPTTMAEDQEHLRDTIRYARRVVVEKLQSTDVGE